MLVSWKRIRCLAESLLSRSGRQELTVGFGPNATLQYVRSIPKCNVQSDRGSCEAYVTTAYRRWFDEGQEPVLNRISAPTLPTPSRTPIETANGGNGGEAGNGGNGGNGGSG